MMAQNNKTEGSLLTASERNTYTGTLRIASASGHASRTASASIRYVAYAPKPVACVQLT